MDDIQEKSAGGGNYEIFVDGSFDGKSYGWGFAVFRDGELILTKKGSGSNPNFAKHRNIAGEVAAAAWAAKWAKDNGLAKVTICHDYQGIAEWARGTWKTNTEMTKRYAAFMRPLRGLVDFRKVTGHTGVEGNELADKLARSALGLD